MRTFASSAASSTSSRMATKSCSSPPSPAANLSGFVLTPAQIQVQWRIIRQARSCLQRTGASAARKVIDMGLKIAVIGAGNIGGAMLGGILKSRLAEPKDVVVTDASEDRRREAEEKWKVRAMGT